MKIKVGELYLESLDKSVNLCSPTEGTSGGESMSTEAAGPNVRDNCSRTPQIVLGDFNRIQSRAAGSIYQVSNKIRIAYLLAQW